MSQIAEGALKSAASDPRLKSLFGGKDVTAMTSKFSDQLCSVLGGGCKAPLSAGQITAGARKLNETQTSAVGEVFSGAMSKSGVNSMTQGLVNQAIGPQLAGILGGLI